MKKHTRGIAILMGLAITAGTIAAPTASMDVQAAGAKVQSTPAYATQWTAQYPALTLLQSALANPRTNADGIYTQLRTALKYRSISESDLVQLLAEGYSIPDEVLQRLISEGWITGAQINAWKNAQSGVQAGASTTATATAAAYAAVFDADYYVNSNPSIAAAVQSGALPGDTETLFQNWLLCGLPIGLKGNASFDIATYEAQNPAVVTACGGDRVAEVTYYVQSLQ